MIKMKPTLRLKPLMTVIKSRDIYNCDSELFLSHLTATCLDTKESRALFICLTRVDALMVDITKVQILSSP